MSIYINSAEAISAQQTFDTNRFLEDVNSHNDAAFFKTLEPDYKQYINPRSLRRMSKVVKMGIAGSVAALRKAGVENPDAIILGTGLGCPHDTIKFLDQLVENDEALLNPTAFIQSTHNTVSGQLALQLKCNNYNFTYTQKDFSFETALVDAVLMLKEGKYKHILVGGVDEMPDKVNELLHQAGCSKPMSESSVVSKTKGFVPGEGGGFFTISTEKKHCSMASILGVSTFDTFGNEDTPIQLARIMRERGVNPSDVDLVISGDVGDMLSDKFYTEVRNIFSKSIHSVYKHLTGDFYTAGSIAMWLGAKAIEEQIVPRAIRMNDIKKDQINIVLVHTHSREYGHAFVLLSSC